MPGDIEREDKLLGALMSYLMKDTDSVSFEQLAKDLDFMVRTKSWRSSWKALIDDKKFIEPVDPGLSTFTSDHKLTQAGKDHASTPEYKEYLKELNFVPQSNEEHQERIKNRLINTKGSEIFDFLIKYGSLTRQELSTLCKVNDRSHKFSYALQDLVTKKKLVEKTGSKLQLTDAAFLDPSDRPAPVALDPTDLAEGKAHIESKKRKTSTASKGKKSSSKTNDNSGPRKQMKEETTDTGTTVTPVSDPGSP